MESSNWQLKNPIDAIIFDCDGTLSSIEGIDELARTNRVHEAVHTLTATAMSTTGINPSIYRKRLDLVRPNRHEIEKLGQLYYQHRTPDCDAVIQILKKFDKKIFVISAGVLSAVVSFAKKLDIAAENVFAVDILYDQQGNYLDFDHTSPLTSRDGKQIFVNQIKSRYPSLGYVGDGLNDLPARDLVTRFVGYGGAYYRENIKNMCEFYISVNSFAPLLALFLTDDEKKQFTEAERKLYEKGRLEI